MMLAYLPPLYRTACLKVLIGQTLSLGELSPEVESILVAVQDQADLTPTEITLLERLQQALDQGQVLKGAWVCSQV